MLSARWFGQGAFLLAGESGRVAIDPFGEHPRLPYAPVDAEAELLLITHEHADHNAAERIGGSPHVVRSRAGTHETPLGDVVGVNSEHDDVAGTKRGANVIFVFTLDGLRLAHFGDFGQRALRPEQRDAIGDVDVVFMPVGAGPTTAVDTAAAIVRDLRARLVVAMHFDTGGIDFLEPVDGFLDAMHGARVARLDTNELALDELLGTSEAPTVAVPAAPR